ncbi:uncharacterized protein [Typha latifolia]|uniref:uncharacterized protein n=1 Tax=Typha latifolia TaxID=4733 RepID=UPI003C2E48A9
MGSCSLRISGIRHLFAECTCDSRCRSAPPLSELVCPEPRRAAIVPMIFDNFSRSKSKGICSFNKGDLGLDILDIILSKDGEYEGESDSTTEGGFFCGTPPARTSNPIVHDAQFSNQTPSFNSPTGNFHIMKPSTAVERGSPSCASSYGSSPRLRIEGFVSALA